MNRIVLSIIPIALIPVEPSTVLAQATFFKTIGAASYSQAYAITSSGDGGYVLTGRAGASFVDDVYIVKTNGIGDTLWTRRLGAPGNEYGFSVCQAGDGGYVVAGFGNGVGAGEYDVILAKTSATGSVLWTRTIGGTRNEEVYGVQRTSEGGFILGGFTTNSLSNDFMLIKTDAAGGTSWIQTFGGESNDQAYAVCQTADGGYALVGRTTSFGVATFEIYVVKTDAAGTMLWNRTYGGSSTDEATDVLPMADGGLLIAGRTFSSGAGSGDLLLIRTDSAGAIQWSRTIGGAGTEDLASVVPTSGGGFALSGTTGSFGSGNDIWLVTTDGTGNPIWSRAFGGSSLESGYGLVQAADGGYVLTGSSNSFGPGLSANIVLIKTDAAGSAGCNTVVSAAIAGTPSPPVGSPSPAVLSPGFTNAAAPFTVTSIADPYVVCAMTSGVGDDRPVPESRLALYPNPASVDVTLLWNAPAARGVSTVSLYDASGRLLTRRVASGTEDVRTERMDLHAYPRGVYFVTVDDGGIATTRKLIKR